MQADAYAGFNRLYEAGRKPGPVAAAMCWSHAGRKLFDVARLNKAPIAIEAALASMCWLRSSATSTQAPPERQRVARRQAGRLVAELKALAAGAAGEAVRPQRDRQAIAYSLKPAGAASSASLTTAVWA